MPRVRRPGAARWPDAARRRLDRLSAPRSCAVVFLALAAVYAATATYHAAALSPDPVAAAVPAWQLATHGNLDLDAHAGMAPWFVPGEDHVASDRMPGIVFFAVPFYLALPSGDEPTLVPAAVAAVVAAAGAMALLHVAFRRLVAPSVALAAALLAGLATATWTVSADGLWPHGIDQLCLAAALCATSVGAWVASGWPLGYAVLTRPLLAVVAAAIGLYHAWVGRTVRPALAIGAVSLVGLAGVVAYNVALFGEVAVAAGYFRRDEALLPPQTPWGYAENVVGTLVSPDRGILVLSPLLLPLVPGLGRAWRAAPAWVRGAAVAGVAYLLVHLALNRFSGGNNFFSYRLPLEALTLVAPLLMVAWREWTSAAALRRMLFAGLAGVSVLIHALGALFWVPVFQERSPWTNFKVGEAVIAGGPWAVALALAVAAVTAAAIVRTGRRARQPAA